MLDGWIGNWGEGFIKFTRFRFSLSQDCKEEEWRKDGMITPGWDRMLDEIITQVWGRMGWLLQDEEGWMITPGWGGWMGWLLQDEEGCMITPGWGRMR